MVLDYWGRASTTPQIWKQAGRPTNGLAAQNLVHYFAKLGFCAESFDCFHLGFRRNKLYANYLDNYDPERLVVMAALEYGIIQPGTLSGHWVVIVEVKPNTIIYNDPARRDGQHLEIDREKFMSAWRMWRAPNAVAVWRP